ncbi:hypothetical protein QCA50_007761 [Cerrena zonata]|uniref:Uncharacterized protein n=1 Tax=Cerrena zonata TaxID=2478898 RepID=A0AAW0G6I1_9APHY
MWHELKLSTVGVHPTIFCSGCVSEYYDRFGLDLLPEARRWTPSPTKATLYCQRAQDSNVLAEHGRAIIVGIDCGVGHVPSGKKLTVIHWSQCDRKPFICEYLSWITGFPTDTTEREYNRDDDGFQLCILRTNVDDDIDIDLPDTNRFILVIVSSSCEHVARYEDLNGSLSTPCLMIIACSGGESVVLWPLNDLNEI